ncbi:TonB-dependent receptor [Oceanicoccus sagamiensis]|uniref:TonB-dependent receptor n=1 Tax=Oceanicoccus sagamiensis TaxID=716816 RepID=A0A1X9N642_9GAMM|nr:TonB-dependent receptor [Oceanicoccus sagamiensis]ARN73570.1 TonB-dependent receptor [Oceanicoccus sagamiensis]
MKKTNLVKAILPAVVASLYSGGLLAQGTLEEVIVTATKRDASIKDVPFSINAQTQDDIRRAGASSIEDIARNVAGLTIQNLGPGQSQVAIRGVSAGQIIRDQPGVKEQVGIYLDESVISLSLFTPDFDLFDLNRVETLRGPQGTLFGSGSVGGTLRYITNQPTFDETEGLIEGDLHTLTDGEEGGHFKGMINIPISDTIAVRAVAYTTEYAGYIDALGENGAKDTDVNGGTRTGGRIAVKFQPSDSLTITPRIVYQELETDGFNRQEVYNLYANEYTTTRPAIQLQEREQYLLLDEEFSDESLLADLVVELNFDGFDLTSITSYTERDILVSRDASALTGSVSVDLAFPDSAVLLPSNLRDNTELEQVTQEIRLSSNGDGDLQWLVGAFYSDSEREYEQRLPTPGYDAVVDAELGDGTSDAVANGFGTDSPYNADLPYDNEQIAVFGEVTYDFSDRLHGTFGLRYYDFEEEREFNSGGLFSNGDNDYDKTTADGVNPRVLLAYDMTDQTTVNGQISQGFRMGGANDPLNVGLCSADDVINFGGNPDYDEETLTNYEVGIKSQISDTFSFNAAVFYADIEDLQATLDAGSCSSRVVFNVPDAHTQGIEVELNAQPLDGLDISAALSVIESEFDSTIPSATGGALGGLEDGNKLASVPEMQFATTATYNFDASAIAPGAEGYISTTFQYIDERITQPGDQVQGAGDFAHGLPFGGATGDEVTSLDLELESYHLINVSTGIRSGTWETVLYINNITDENVDLSFDRERGGRARLGYRTNQPRTMGVTIRKSF